MESLLRLCRRHRDGLLALALLLLTLGTFAHTCDNGFVNFDDVYVTSHWSVLGGITPTPSCGRSRPRRRTTLTR